MKRILDRLDLNVTPLVAYGLIGLVLIFGIFGLETYHGKQQKVQAKLETRQSELITLETIKNTDMWPVRLVETMTLKEEVEAKIWNGNTNGVIAAELQQTLTTISKKHDVKNVNVTVDPEISNVEGVDILRFDYTGRIASGKDTIDFFNDMTLHKRAIIISELSVTNSLRDRRPSNMTISGLIPISVPAE